MARFEDTPALFGISGGCVTYGDIDCHFCGEKYEGREDSEGQGIASESISVDHFGNLQVCDCCFENLENAVLLNMSRILPWYVRILQSRKLNLDTAFGNVNNIKILLAEMMAKPSA
jgi:hypothetical protein